MNKQTTNVFKCTKCGTDDENLLMKYSFHPKRNVQYYMCRDCNRSRRQKYYYNGGKDLIYKLNREQQTSDSGKIKQRARQAVSQAVKSGKLLKSEVCSECNGTEPRIEAHHTDYTLPLVVIWLCTPCHRKADRNML